MLRHAVKQHIISCWYSIDKVCKTVEISVNQMPFDRKYRISRESKKRLRSIHNCLAGVVIGWLIDISELTCIGSCVPAFERNGIEYYCINRTIITTSCCNQLIVQLYIV